ncbi:MAG: antitoxin [Intrasporangium sp.]|uniref:antitoxin n=1 Tax=Intrasporangium sp. TaxID=1925024 RepID=UPI002649E326|nr:antitoxin [Intrasporangium sp.]MDN5795303.1 antitoxin [Intrasporangium sp.]
MGTFDEMKDKAAGLVDQAGDKIGEGIDKAGDLIDEKTGGKYADKVDVVQEKVKDGIDGIDGQNDDIP